MLKENLVIKICFWERFQTEGERYFYLIICSTAGFSKGGDRCGGKRKCRINMNKMGIFRLPARSKLPRRCYPGWRR
jgi:hypothetical protein